MSEDEVRRELRRVNIRKAAGPDGITGRVLRSCADQLAGLFTSIFNESLATSVIPTSFKGKGKWCVAKYGDPYSEFVLCI